MLPWIRAVNMLKLPGKSSCHSFGAPPLLATLWWEPTKANSHCGVRGKPPLLHWPFTLKLWRFYLSISLFIPLTWTDFLLIFFAFIPPPRTQSVCPITSFSFNSWMNDYTPPSWRHKQQLVLCYWYFWLIINWLDDMCLYFTEAWRGGLMARYRDCFFTLKSVICRVDSMVACLPGSPCCWLWILNL